MVENHPLLRANPELAAALAARVMADDTFAQMAQQYAGLDEKVQSAAASAGERDTHASLEQQLLEALKPAKSSGCCGGCGGKAH